MSRSLNPAGIDPVTGKPISKSTLLKILIDQDHWLQVNVATPDNWKKKACKQQFPILEDYLIEWVHRAQQVQVVTTDDIIFGSANALQRSWPV